MPTEILLGSVAGPGYGSLKISLPKEVELACPQCGELQSMVMLMEVDPDKEMSGVGNKVVIWVDCRSCGCRDGIPKLMTGSFLVAVQEAVELFCSQCGAEIYKPLILQGKTPNVASEATLLANCHVCGCCKTPTTHFIGQ